MSLIPEETIEPLTRIDSVDAAAIDEDAAREALDRTALIKLNGGLGTSMGMDRAKSLLPVRGGRTFLDLLVDQVMAARRRYGARLPLIFMNSFRTRADTLAALAARPGVEVDGLPLDFLQNREPKLRADDLSPVQWPADPELEWCPPGHGDIYTALVASGVLDALLERGYRYAMTSNSDNLGAAPSARLAGWFAASGTPYAPEAEGLGERLPAVGAAVGLPFGVGPPQGAFPFVVFGLLGDPPGAGVVVPGGLPTEEAPQRDALLAGYSHVGA